MMQRLKINAIIFAAAASLVIFGSWKLYEQHDIKKAAWLIGTWACRTPKGTIYETWHQTNDFEYSGKSFFLKAKDSIVLETIRLVQEQDVLYYIPTVNNQNNN